MRNEELGGMWLNRFSNLNTLNNTPLHRGHVTSQPQSSSSVFSMIHDDCVDVDVTLSNDFARMSVFNELGNVGVKARGNGYGYGANVMDSSYPHAFSHSLCSFDAHVHEETATPLPIWGVSVSSDLKGHTFGPPMEFSSHTQRSNPCYGQVPLQNPFHATRPFAMDCDVKSPFLMQQQPKVAMNVNTPSSHYFPAAKERGTTRVAVNPNGGDFSHSREDPLGFQCDGGFILQEKDVKCCNGCRGCNSLWGCNESLSLPVQEVGVGEELPQHIPSRVAPTKHEKNGVLASDVSPSSQPLLYNFSPLAKFQGYIYYLAKDQNGCRFLQRMIDEGTSEDVLVLFNGVIDDVVELMIDPFGNYLVQKLLDVCGEDERLQVVSMLTEEPGQLVKTSLNLHGTRVVQKLITTVDSRKQIAMLRSAIQSGFLALIKDLNGNHVIQRCLQYFSCKDNEVSQLWKEQNSPSVEGYSPMTIMVKILFLAS
ncbi:hypothetical protein JHK82_035721 [Glycine max]|nr:hypothetical protein JHK85_036448 [Glycine max]KAG5112452.1 hypothetical protein JHK82_035721 [Glycine max]KAG5129728.1 hypothetical protein JHK84_036125 [Glycine max]